MLPNQSRRFQCRGPLAHLIGVNTWPSHTEIYICQSQALPVPRTFGERFMKQNYTDDSLAVYLFFTSHCGRGRGGGVVCSGLARYSCCFMNIWCISKWVWVSSAMGRELVVSAVGGVSRTKEAEVSQLPWQFHVPSQSSRVIEWGLTNVSFISPHRCVFFILFFQSLSTKLIWWQ